MVRCKTFKVLIIVITLILAIIGVLKLAFGINVPNIKEVNFNILYTYELDSETYEIAKDIFFGDDFEYVYLDQLDRLGIYLEDYNYDEDYILAYSLGKKVDKITYDANNPFGEWEGAPKEYYLQAYSEDDSYNHTLYLYVLDLDMDEYDYYFSTLGNIKTLHNGNNKDYSFEYAPKSKEIESNDTNAQTRHTIKFKEMMDQTLSEDEIGAFLDKRAGKKYSTITYDFLKAQRIKMDDVDATTWNRADEIVYSVGSKITKVYYDDSCYREDGTVHLSADFEPGEGNAIYIYIFEYGENDTNEYRFFDGVN